MSSPLPRNSPVPEAEIQSLSHEGRGVARIAGKTVFIDGALPGERVSFRYLRRRGRFDEGVAEAVNRPTAARSSPPCPHFPVCGGCRLQHMEPGAQIRHKEAVLLEQLEHAGVDPGEILPPLTGPALGYRRRARLGVKFVAGKGRVLVGFRERGSNLLADIDSCAVLHPALGNLLPDLARLVGCLSVADAVPQIEAAAGADRPLLVFRHLRPLSAADREHLHRFQLQHGAIVCVQPGGEDSVQPLTPGTALLSRYRLDEFNVEIRFAPTDFTQVNFDINQALVARVAALLDPGPEDRVLDLFCGLGNFSLPLARRAARVTGVDGDAALIGRARDNALLNAVDNVEFERRDLERGPWDFGRGYTHVLLDPPRCGARPVVENLPLDGVRRIACVSCNPATLCRDAATLVRERGFGLRSAGVVDMFPHTAHMECVALFERE